MEPTIQQESIASGFSRRDRNYKRKKDNRPWLIALSVMTAVVLLLFAGMRIQASRYHEPLPANQACREAMVKQSAWLKASLDSQFGVPIPEGTPSADEVKQLQTQCDATVTSYTVEVAK